MIISYGGQIVTFGGLVVQFGPFESDSTNPQISLNDSADIFLPIGFPFIDPGATATDAEDGDLSDQVVISGHLNLYVPGTYTLTYSVTDSDGNTASITRTIHVDPDLTFAEGGTAMSFFHGVKMTQNDAGARPITAANVSVIGIVGTAPNAYAGDAANITLTGSNANTALKFAAKSNGVAGNQISVALVDPAANSAALGVVVTGNDIVVNLATSAGGAITSTAAQVKAAIEASSPANALVAVTHASGSTGAGVVSAKAKTNLAGGVDEAFPLNKPVLIAGSLAEAAKLDTLGTGVGTLPRALSGILDQRGAFVVVVRVAVGVNDAATQANVIGGTQGDGSYTGLRSLLGAESALGLKPKLIIAPGFSHVQAVAAEMQIIATSLRGIAIADGPSTTDTAAQAYAAALTSDAGRIYLVDPRVKVFNTATALEEFEYTSARVAGVVVDTDYRHSDMRSPSNKSMAGIIGTERAIDSGSDDGTDRATLLNGNNIAVIIQRNGYRLWGNRLLCSDPMFTFINVRRVDDMIRDSIQDSIDWAVDRNITKAFEGEVSESVNAFLRELTAKGIIAGGKCWPDPDLNTSTARQAGKVYFNYEFEPYYPAECIEMRGKIATGYYEGTVK